MFINFYSERLCKYISITLLVTSLPLMATYANSLKNQKMFEDFLVNNISTKIELSNKKIVFDGGVPWAPELQNAINNFPLISVLVPRYMNYDWTWGKKFLEKNTYTKTQTVMGEEYEEIIKTKKSIPIIDKTDYYYLRSIDSIIVVDFEKEDS